MSTGNLGTRNLYITALAVAGAIALFEVFVRQTPDATFLVALTFWSGIVQGCLALAAGGELAGGRWLVPINRELYSVYPLLLIIALLSLVLGAKMDIYGWSKDPDAIRWLDVKFFLIRNFVVQLLAFFAARQFVVSVRKQSSNKNRWAGIYVAMFVVSQSFVAFDWIMTLEYPWISTLLGGYFFIEAFLMGLAVCAFILLFRMKTPGHGLAESLRDTSKLMFGFSVVWIGFFFAQFLVIWYANIPEEVGVLLRRINEPPYSTLSLIVMFLVWVLPFSILLSRPLKTVPGAMVVVATLILAGLLLEKVVLVLPVVAVNPVFLGVEVVLLTALAGLFISNRDSIVPG